MKLLLVTLTALVAFATVNSHQLPAFGEGPLYEDIQYFLDMIPFEKIGAIVLEYAAEDAEFQGFLKYLQSDEVSEMMEEVEAIPEFRQFVDYLQNNGVNSYKLLNQLNKLKGLAPYKPNSYAIYRITGGVKGLFEDCKAQISYDSIIHGYVYKMKTSASFREFVAHLKSKDNQHFVDTLYKNKSFLHFRQVISDKGIDVALIEDVIYTVLGVEFPDLKSHLSQFETTYENQLSKDISDFYALIDEKKLSQVIGAHMQDKEVQKTIVYMRSEKFHALVRKVEAMQEYQDLVIYLHNAGLDIYRVIRNIHGMLHMEHYVPPTNGKYSSFAYVSAKNGGLKAMFDDIIAVLPMDKLKALYEQKMKTSTAFKTFVEKLQTPAFKKIVDTVYSTPSFLELRQQALEAGLDLSLPRILLEKVFGFKLPVPNTFFLQTFAAEQNQLSKDMHEFLALIDMNKITKVVQSHLDDEEVQKALVYMYSEEFHALVRKVEAMKEYQDLVIYLHNAGLNVYNLIEKIHKLFGMEDYVPPVVGKFSTFWEVFVNKGGVKGLVDDVIAVLPMDKLKALYEQKMKTSTAFKTFVEKLQTPEFKKIVDTVYSSPIFLEMRQKALAAGLDLSLAQKLLEKVFGFKLPVPNTFFLQTFAAEQNQLSKDMHEFLALIDMNKITKVVQSHLDDEEVQKVLVYMYSEEFHALVRKVEAMKEYQDLVIYLHNAGLNIFDLIEKIHKLFGMEDYVPPVVGKFSTFWEVFVNKGGVKGLVDDVIAVLPMDKLKALYEQKMKTSTAFKTFVEKLQTPEFKKIVDTVYSSPIFLEMRQKALAAGLDLSLAQKLLEKIFGFKLPVPNTFFLQTFAAEQNQLSKDMHEFLALIDMNKITKVVQSHLDDEEVQKALVYMYSEEFHALVRKVEAMKEYQDLVIYLHNAGLNIFDLIEKIHKLFGMEDYVPPVVGKFSTFWEVFVNKGGVKGLVDDVIAVLPMDKLKALYEQKMKTSTAFKTFVEKLQTPEFKKIVDTVYSSPIFLEMRQKALAAGLDLSLAQKLLEKVFGFKLPVPNTFIYRMY